MITIRRIGVLCLVSVKRLLPISNTCYDPILYGDLYKVGVQTSATGRASEGT